MSFTTTYIYSGVQHSAYLLADVFKEVVVDLRKEFHLIAELYDTLEQRKDVLIAKARVWIYTGEVTGRHLITISLSLVSSWAQERNCVYLEKGITGSGSSRMYSFSSDATVWTSVVL